MTQSAQNEKPFDVREYRKEWNKKHMKMIGASYKTEFVEEYQASVKALDLKTSQLIRRMMQDVIDQARVEAPERVAFYLEQIMDQKQSG